MNARTPEALRALPWWEDSPPLDSALGQRVKCLSLAAHLEAIYPLLRTPALRKLAADSLGLALANYRLMTALELSNPGLATRVALAIHEALQGAAANLDLLDEARYAADELGVPAPRQEHLTLLLHELNREPRR